VLNKAALVTGSTAGIGLPIATTLAKEGAAVIVNGRTQQRVDEALQTSDAAYSIVADLATETRARSNYLSFPNRGHIGEQCWPANHSEEDIADVDCCGCLIVRVRGGEADILCKSARR
jgi:NAD(P)-dependent dehydrogenase (short-subunit alcohol dehydrogenase family)